jgi:hypothetical protein
VAVIGISFGTDQFVALTGLPEPEAYAALDAALAGLVVVHTGSGYRFRHPLSAMRSSTTSRPPSRACSISMPLGGSKPSEPRRLG